MLAGKGLGSRAHQDVLEAAGVVCAGEVSGEIDRCMCSAAADCTVCSLHTLDACADSCRAIYGVNPDCWRSVLYTGCAHGQRFLLHEIDDACAAQHQEV